MRHAANSSEVQVTRNLTLRSAAYTASTGTYDGVDYLVVPLVVLIPGVAIQAMEAPNPELITPEVINDTVNEWLGRPTISMHPAGGISANDISLGHLVLGRINNPRVNSAGSLMFDAWVNPIKAAAIGGDSAALVDRINSGEEIEVSIGCLSVWIDMNQKGTDVNGVKYIGAWVHLAADHVALLPSNRTGACGVKVGCGARDATAAANSLSKSRGALHSAGGNPMRGLIAQIRQALTGVPEVYKDHRSAAKTVSSKQIYKLLRAAVKEVEGDDYYCWDIEWWDDRVIYVLSEDYDSDKSYQRGYVLDESVPSVTLSADRTEVTKPEPEWVEVVPDESAVISPDVINPPVNSVSETIAREATTPCACQGERAMSENSKPAENVVPVTMPPTNPVPETPAAPVAARAAEGTNETVSIPAAELAALRSLAAREQVRAASEHASLVAEARELSTKIGSAIPDAALNAMSADQLAPVVTALRGTARAAGIAIPIAPVNFALQNGAGIVAASESKIPPAPDIVSASRAMYGKADRVENTVTN